MEFIEKIREGYAAFGAYQTWYRVTGDLSSGRTPLVDHPRRPRLYP